MYTSNDILFPRHVIPSLKNLRSNVWAALVERVSALPETHEETIAFMLLMIRLNGCLACETDSYRAMRGCTACAQQTLRRFKGEDSELVEMFEKALKDVRAFAMQHDHLDILMPSS
ncbi:MAG: hypothetical protein Q9P44_21890 [Anaerolineae bacterium]|nr:hypothetical protein [Anaerolineae bacterium]